MKNVLLFLFVLLSANVVFAQRDSVVVLDEVVLTDSRLRDFSNGIKVRTLTDSVLMRNSGMLTDNLRATTLIYFKESGYGMISSASFRGTTAQQTAVVWNGININSQLTGQTDFNALMPQNLDGITVRSGGGSTQYGTGAVGGSIHLNNQLDFDTPLENKLRLGYGSFDTRNLFYKAAYGTEKMAITFGLGHFASENDYEYLGTDQKNENGAFSNNAFDLAFGFLASKSHLIKLYHHTFLGNRDFSGTLTAPSDDNYRNFDARTLLEWVHFKSNRVQRVRGAYLFERFRYYPNNTNENFSFGKSGNFQVDYDYKYELKKWTLNGIVSANSINAEGSSISTANRNQLSAILLVSHNPTEKLSYGMNFRQDWVSDYQSPFVFSVDAKYQLLQNYSIRANTSKNYRVPTFNDIYWQGAGASGNANVLPESALQGELGQTLSGNGYKVDLTGFYISTTDLIQWRPDVTGIWTPINIKDVSQYGLELQVNMTKKLGPHRLVWDNGYSYTKAIDNETKNQLLYVPLHKFTSNLAYRYRRWGAFLRGLYNGRVFTTTDNNNELSDYLVLDSGLEYRFPEVSGVELKTILAINNLGNRNYQNVAFRPMPNRNIHLNLNFKF
ncbi:TonB-dependent receptor [Aggregatimonas sangjinii]|uniref:TonB-dependent receptor n=1 Tax=Aggregatimonas sangjinii TaxID=2583587 RepID=A0A5B7STV9_9FLAO|nr:TonB-dependent receptor [Aggregatimonas sangjinii]QCX00341.1 TonB-dependent receptor [Aggregatimonas sangjinii]